MTCVTQFIIGLITIALALGSGWNSSHEFIPGIDDGSQRSLHLPRI